MPETDDIKIDLLNRIHEINSDSLELEAMIAEAMPEVEALDPDHDLGLYDFNYKMLKTLMAQRILMTKFMEYGMIVDDALEQIKDTLDHK